MLDKEEALIKKINNTYKTLVSGDLQVVSELETYRAEAKKNKNYKAEVLAINGINSWYKYNSNFSKSEALSLEALKIAKKIKDNDLIAAVYNDLGSVYSRIGELKKSLEFYTKGITLYDEIKNYEKKARILANLGQNFSSKNDYKRAEYYLLEAWNIFKKEENKSQNWIILNSLSSLYHSKGEIKKSLKFCQLCYDSAIEYNKDIGVSFAYRGFSLIEASNERYEEAIEYLYKSLKIVEEKGVHLIKDSILINIAQYLIKLSKLSEAKKIVKKVLKASRQEERKQQSHLELYEIYKQEKNSKKALFHYEKYIEIKEATEGAEAKKEAANLEARFQNKLKESEKEILRLQKVEMEQKALRAQLNPHFFFNSLNSIHKFIMDNDKENATSFLQKFSSLMRKTLENSEESFITIEEEIAFLKDYLSLEQLRFNHSFQFEFVIDEEIEEDFFKIPTMMLQPYIENSIKHGLNGIENGKIIIEFILDGDMVMCIVEDNGRGRGLSQSNHQSMGTTLLNDRIKVFKEQYNFDFSIETIDLKNEENHPLGTKVKLLMPILENV